MVRTRLRNPDIILTPITENEKEEIEKRFMGDEELYVLYTLPNSDDINIGMMSTSMRRYFPATANVWNLKKATSLAYFYNGCSELANRAQEITDRPVYRVQPSDDLKVSGYTVLNGTDENGLNILLEDVVSGMYILKSDNSIIR